MWGTNGRSGLVFAAAVLTACSGSHFPISSPRTPPQPGTATASTPSIARTTTSLDPNNDLRALRLAHGGNVGLVDVPAGWTLQSTDTGGGASSGDPSIPQAFAACLRVTDRTVMTDFLPHDYVVLADPSGGGVMSTVTVFPNVRDARAAFVAAGAPIAPSCKAAEMRAVFLTEGYGVIVTGGFVPTGLAGHTAMIRETVRFSNTLSTTREDFLYAERGPAFVYMDIQTPSLDTSFELAVLRKSLDRLNALHVADAS
jgi:hypothetical protein